MTFKEKTRHFFITYKKAIITISTLIMVLVLIYSFMPDYFKVSHWLKSKNNAEEIQHEMNDKDFVYTCPMHPTINTDKPGVCPICNMNLVKRTINKKPASHSDMPEHTQKDSLDKDIMSVSISPAQQIMANIETAHPVYRTVSKNIEAFGTITYDTKRLSTIPVWIDGRLEKLYIKEIGNQVKKGDLIAEIYSPELIVSQKEYLYALENLKEMNNSEYDVLVNSYKKTLEAAKNRLKHFGLSDKQIVSLTDFEDINNTIPIYSKYSGTVIKQHIYEGDYVKEGERLYTLADFSHLWLEAEVSETDIAKLKVHQEVEIHIDSYPGSTFKGHISYIYPFMDNETRTVKVRVILKNFQGQFKPDMYARTVIKTFPERHLTIPVTAIFYTGKNSYVWLEKQPGIFVMRHINTGRKYDDVIEVIDGLDRYDNIAVTGGFLIDSEAQLTTGMSGGHQH